MGLAGIGPMKKVSPRIKRWLNVVGLTQLLIVGGWTYVVAQQQGTSQDVINERIAQQIQQLGSRVLAIEDTRPFAMEVRLKNIEDKQQQQQTLLWGIAVAVIINLLTSNTGRFSFRLRRQNERWPTSGERRQNSRD